LMEVVSRKGLLSQFKKYINQITFYFTDIRMR